MAIGDRQQQVLGATRKRAETLTHQPFGELAGHGGAQTRLTHDHLGDLLALDQRRDTATGRLDFR